MIPICSMHMHHIILYWSSLNTRQDGMNYSLPNEPGWPEPGVAWPVCERFCGEAVPCVFTASAFCLGMLRDLPSQCYAQPSYLSSQPHLLQKNMFIFWGVGALVFQWGIMLGKGLFVYIPMHVQKHLCKHTCTQTHLQMYMHRYICICAYSIYSKTYI